MLASSRPVTIVTANGKEKKKKKKRKLEHVDIEKESQVSKKKNKMSKVREALGETLMRIDDNLGLQKNVQVDFVSNSESDVRRDRKRNHKEKNREGKTITVSSVVNSIDDNRREEVFAVQKGPGNEDITNMNNMEGQGRKKEKKRKQNKYDDGSCDTGIVKGVAGGKDAGREESTEVVQDKAESSKEEEEKKKKKRFNVLEAASLQIMAETTGSQYSVIEGDGGSTSSIKKKARDGKLKVNAEGGNKRKKKAKSLENHSKEKSSERVTEMEEDAETTHSSEKSSSKVTSKRVIEGDGGSTSSIKKKARDGKLKVNAEGGNKRKKKAKSLENHSKEKSSERVTEMEEDAETTHSSEKSSSKVTSKRVIEGDGGSTSSIKKKARDGKLKVNAEGGNKRKKKAKSLENHSKEKSSERVTEMEEDAETTHSSEKSSSKVTSKRVIEGDGGSTSSIKKKARDGKLKVNAEGGNKRKKKAKSLENHSKEKSSERVTEMEEDAETTHSSEKSSSKVTSKRVSFCEDVEIFPSSDGPSGKKAVGEDGLVRGKRFSHEEDEAVKEAVLNYINVHGLGADGLNMVLNCVKHPAIKHCWKEIGAALPWRPRESVYYRAHILFERDQNSSWTPEEYDLIRKFHEKHGSDWKTLAEALGKHRFHVKDTWRRIKLINMKKGKWSQDEYQFLFDSVNLDLRLKAFEERKTKHGMLRDNISWTAISEKLETRTDALCCQKWYDQLTSPMVAEGKWLDTDDYRLLMELYDLDACCMEDVDWDNLLEHRSGDLCRKRWNQMVKHLGDHRNKSFAEQVDVLINRYCPDVLDAREAYNSKPAVT